MNGFSWPTIEGGHMITILSLGAGVQSTTMASMAVAGITLHHLFAREPLTQSVRYQ